MAYYMFVNHGWPPSKYDALSEREKVLVSIFARKEIESREKQRK